MVEEAGRKDAKNGGKDNKTDNKMAQKIPPETLLEITATFQ